jgi:hypothetical protein
MPLMRLEAPYRPRPIRLLRLADLGGWRVKVYGISAHRERPDPTFLEAAERLARERLPEPPRWSAGEGATALVSVASIPRFDRGRELRPRNASVVRTHGGIRRG